ncbi:MAG TPA: alpha/beta hydrolase [Gammaproteobacteria bacterium]|nr:alpha/beta hydrolase [Gammaproteobacteria bacterium]
MLRKHLKFFQDPHIDYPIYDFNLNFSAYIKQSEEIIRKTRQDLGQDHESIIKNNAPFELQPHHSKPQSAALLIHGLLDSPFIMRDIGNYLQSQGLLVRSIMLPGHSTVPGALLNTDYTEWLQAVQYGVGTLKRDGVEKIFLVGFSTGADLSICHAVNDPAIAGIIMIAPALKINSPFAFMSNWYRAFNWAGDRTKWFFISEEFDSVKYQSVTFNAIYQVYRLGLLLQKISPEKLAHCPLLMALSYEDKIVCSKMNMEYFQKTTHPLTRILVYSNKSLKFSDKRIILRNSVYPDMNILNFCHITLPVSPDNPHYGKDGDYILASHLEKNVRYGAFDKLDMCFYNTLRKMHLSPYRYERLTFNPDFEFMKNQMGDFILKALDL